MKLLLDVLKGKNKGSIPPIWLMRQAGRYLHEYRKVRQEAGGFLDLCYNPELASKVTLQPIDRFDFDAAIIFSDILVVPHMLGLDVRFLEGEGPKVENITDVKDLEKLSVKKYQDSWPMQKICSALQLTKQNLANNKTLIGFAGSPWTVSTYIISEKKHDFEGARRFAYEKKELLRELINLITEQTIIYLKNKIECGAEVIQLFDSWCSVLPEKEFAEFVIEPTKKIVKEIKNYAPTVPIIGFPKGAGVFLKDFAKETKVDCLGIDYLTPMWYAKELQKDIPIQGNLDPLSLFLSKDEIADCVDNIMANLAGGSFIFNLGHGIMQHTPVENVEFLVRYVRTRKK